MPFGGYSGFEANVGHPCGADVWAHTKRWRFPVTWNQWRNGWASLACVVSMFPALLWRKQTWPRDDRRQQCHLGSAIILVMIGAQAAGPGTWHRMFRNACSLCASRPSVVIKLGMLKTPTGRLGMLYNQYHEAFQCICFSNIFQWSWNRDSRGVRADKVKFRTSTSRAAASPSSASCRWARGLAEWRLDFTRTFIGPHRTRNKC